MAAKKSGTVETVKVGSSWKITSPVELQDFAIKRGRNAYHLARIGELGTKLLEAPTLAELKVKIETQLANEGLGGIESPPPSQEQKKVVKKGVAKAVKVAKTVSKQLQKKLAEPGEISEAQARENHVTEGLKKGLKKARATKPEKHVPAPAPLNTKEQQLADQLSEWGESWTLKVSEAGRTEGKTVLVGISAKVPKRIVDMLAIHKFTIADKPDGYSRNNPKKAMRTLWLLKAS